MDPYRISLLIGGAGLGVMAVSGLSHHVHLGGARAHGSSAGANHGHGGTPSHAGHGNAHVQGHEHGHSTHVNTTGQHAAHSHMHASDAAARAALTLMSPRFLFSALLGLGLTGILLRPFFGGAPLVFAATTGGIAFERALVRPIWDFLMRFASKPAMTLESCIMEDATAVTSFDGNGQGIVAVELDGQVIQLLATLQSADSSFGGRVRAGAKVRIEDVDTAQNRCTVSLL